MSSVVNRFFKEFLAYGVLYAIGQDVGVGEVDNLLERLITSAYLEIWKIV